ncbi:GNAT family N-acetyltransferase [Devosia sp. SL43]|uniref:GNAT family N-acetyltransferase n=1 Tax=Devosia sp. SL43 TaxID=2806348 RepID=UPI001F31CE6D|nr:GNAT family protein [Devosia sp. SL43]UJW83917.1 GNAT family N-acetyltransferase [Devosia sp. SL43]
MTAPNIEIRPIREQDIGAFRAAVDAVARERHYLSTPQGPTLEGAANFVRNNIEKGNPQFVAIVDGSLVGWCDIVRGEGDFKRHVGTMGMGLLPPWRERGIGRQLLARTLAAADAVDLSRVELSVHASNERAIRLYESLGFEHEGRQRSARFIDSRFEDIVLMARLAPSLLL